MAVASECPLQLHLPHRHHAHTIITRDKGPCAVSQCLHLAVLILHCMFEERVWREFYWKNVGAQLSALIANFQRFTINSFDTLWKPLSEAADGIPGLSGNIFHHSWRWKTVAEISTLGFSWQAKLQNLYSPTGHIAHRYLNLYSFKTYKCNIYNIQQWRTLWLWLLLIFHLHHDPLKCTKQACPAASE